MTDLTFLMAVGSVFTVLPALNLFCLYFTTKGKRIPLLFLDFISSPIVNPHETLSASRILSGEADILTFLVPSYFKWVTPVLLKSNLPN